MAITIEKVVDLDVNAQIIHEANDGELVQYYISDGHERDKKSQAEAVYDPTTGTWSYKTYDELEWSDPQSRITDEALNRLIVKALPGYGAIAGYHLTNENIDIIDAPLNCERLAIIPSKDPDLYHKSVGVFVSKDYTNTHAVFTGCEADIDITEGTIQLEENWYDNDGSKYVPHGYYRSEDIIFNESVDRVIVRWEGDVPEGTSVVIYARQSDSPDGFYGAWSSTTDHIMDLNGSTMKVQYALALYSEDGTSTPVVSSVKVTFRKEMEDQCYMPIYTNYGTFSYMPAGLDETLRLVSFDVSNNGLILTIVLDKEIVFHSKFVDIHNLITFSDGLGWNHVSYYEFEIGNGQTTITLHLHTRSTTLITYVYFNSALSPYVHMLLDGRHEVNCTQSLTMSYDNTEYVDCHLDDTDLVMTPIVRQLGFEYIGLSEVDVNNNEEVDMPIIDTIGFIYDAVIPTDSHVVEDIDLPTVTTIGFVYTQTGATPV